MHQYSSCQIQVTVTTHNRPLLAWIKTVWLETLPATRTKKRRFGRASGTGRALNRTSCRKSVCKRPRKKLRSGIGSPFCITTTALRGILLDSRQPEAPSLVYRSSHFPISAADKQVRPSRSSRAFAVSEGISDDPSRHSRNRQLGKCAGNADVIQRVGQAPSQVFRLGDGPPYRRQGGICHNLQVPLRKYDDFNLSITFGCHVATVLLVSVQVEVIGNRPTASLVFVGHPALGQ